MISLTKLKVNLKLPHVNFNIRYVIAAVIIITAIISFIFSIIWYFDNTEVVEHNVPIALKYDRYEFDHNDYIEIGNFTYTKPVYDTHYYFELENEKTFRVSYSIYNKYEVGDIYTYTTREWKD